VLHGFVYDRSERPVSISGAASGSFVYDAHGRRVKQVLAGETTYSVYGLDGTLLYRDNASTGEETDYIAMGSNTVGRFDAAGAFTFIHSDHLGSASAATNASGAVAWRESYTPFGELLDDPSANRNQPGFTGHVRDAATGLTYAQARYYNPVTARFLSPDPVGFADMGPGYFNRYAYTANDPLNNTDPDGAVWGKVARFGVRVVATRGNVVRAGREFAHELRQDGAAVISPHSTSMQRAVGLFNLVSLVTTRDIEGLAAQAGIVESIKSPPLHCIEPLCDAYHGGATETGRCPDCEHKHRESDGRNTDWWNEENRAEIERERRRGREQGRRDRRESPDRKEPSPEEPEG